jgi:hypothetical protein
MTHTKQQQQLAIANRAQVLKTLGWNELQYGTFQMEQGEAYLRELLNQDDWWIDALIAEKLFWQWWINAWNNRDEWIYLPNINTFDDVEASYRAIHSTQSINCHPSKYVLDEGYKNMMRDIQKNAQTQNAKTYGTHH